MSTPRQLPQLAIALALSAASPVLAQSFENPMAVGPRGPRAATPIAPPADPFAPADPRMTPPAPVSGADPAPVVEPPPAPAPEPAPVVVESKPPTDLAVGSRGLVSVHALLQAWVDTNPAADKFGEDPEATFRIRRAELRISGDIISKRVSYVVMTDLARSLFKMGESVTVTNPDGSTSTVQGVQADNLLPIRDAYTIIKSEHVDVWLGQFKIPISLEGLTSPAQLLLPERSVVAKAFGDKRDLGVKLEKRKDRFYYGLSAYNGAGENRLDTDNTKEAAGRFEFTPKFGENAKLLLAVAGLASIGPAEQQHRQLIEGDVRFEYGGFLVQGEVISSLTRGAADENGVQSEKGGLGFYASSAYTHPAGFQVAGRAGMLDNDTATAAAEDSSQVGEFGASVNYFFLRSKKESNFFSEHPEFHEAKVQLSFNRFVPTAPDHQITDEVILALQSWF